MLDALWETECSSPNSPTQAPLGDAIESELTMYRNIKYAPTKYASHKNQLTFWNAHQKGLSAYAMHILVAQASEAESERLFSQAGRVLIRSRASFSILLATTSSI
jgi:hypothetical protein